MKPRVLIIICCIYVAGGYIFKYDNDNHDEGDKIITSGYTELEFVMVYPKKDVVTQDQLNYMGQ